MADIILTGTESTSAAQSQAGILVLTESPNYVAILEIRPSRILPKKITRNKITYEFEDGRQRTKNLSNAKYDVEVQWDYISESDRGTVFDWYNDPNKADGMARTFYWRNPLSGNLEIARFLGPMRTVFEPALLQKVDAIPMRVSPQ